MVIEIKDKEQIKDLFAGWNESLLYSCLQDHMGSAYASENHESAMILVDVFCFYAGKPNIELLEFTRNNVDGSYIITARDATWNNDIEEVFSQYNKTQRYAIKKEVDVFDEGHLNACVSALPKGYSLEFIDEIHYKQVLAQSWARDLCAVFKNVEQYLNHGLGVVAIKDHEIIGGASSYAYYDSGIEIEVDTRKDHRRKGIALACSAKLILECLRRGWYPSWDAQNLNSVALAEKLGYHFAYAYDIYEISDKKKNV